LESSDPKYTTPFATAVAEVAEGNRPSPDQLEFLDRVHQNNGIGFVAYSLDDVMRVL
jgi:hypothetical protein